MVLSAILFLNSGCGSRKFSSLTSGTFDYFSQAGNLPNQYGSNSALRDQSARAQSGGTSSPATSSPSGSSWASFSAGSGSGSTISVATAQTAVNFGELNTCYQNVLNQGIQNLRNSQYSVQDVYVGAGAELLKCYQYILTIKQQQYNTAAQQQQYYQAWMKQWASLIQNQFNQSKTAVPLTRPPSVLTGSLQ